MKNSNTLEGIRHELGSRLYRAAINAARKGAKWSNRKECLAVVRNCKGRKRGNMNEQARTIEHLCIAWDHLRSFRNWKAAGRTYYCERGWEPAPRPSALERLQAFTRLELLAVPSGSAADLIGWHPSFGELHICADLPRGSAVSVETDEQYLGRYSSRCTYQKIEHNGWIHAPQAGVRSHDIDGIYTIEEKASRVSVGGITAWHGWMITKGRGYTLKSKDVWVAEGGGNMSAHGKTRRDAVKALARKRSAAARMSAPLTRATLVSAADYQRITGACNPGTNAWLEEHGFTRRDRITAGELAELLRPGDWGRDRFLAAITD